MRAVALLAALLVAAPAAAKPCVSAVALDYPCDGILVPEADARRALRCLAVDLPAAGADLAECERIAEARAAGSSEMLEALGAENLALKASLARSLSLEPRPWWDDPALWFGGGVAVGAALVTGIVYALGGL